MARSRDDHCLWRRRGRVLSTGSGPSPVAPSRSATWAAVLTQSSVLLLG